MFYDNEVKMNDNIAIKVEHLSKIYKIFNKPVDRLKETLNPFHKRYSKDFYALKDISFEIKKGETVGIIGKNGAGKSTLLKILTGVVMPSSGDIKVNGRIASLLELGAGFNPEMTGIENIYLNGTVMGYSKKEMDDRLENIINFADIGDFISQPVKMYSSGMFARLAFSVNAFVEPDILIVDEALSVGDLEFQTKCYRKFNELKDNNSTIIFVTHDINAILKFCDRAFLLKAGKLLGQGNAKYVIDLYKKIISKNNKSIVENKVNANEIDSNWKDSLQINNNYLEYGTKEIKIIDFAIENEDGEITSIVSNEEIVHIKMRVRTVIDIDSPILAYAVKDLKGIELIGTNTLVELFDVNKLLKGNIYDVIFKQKLPLIAGSYTLSLGCTKYVNNKLVIYHRLYDIAFIKIISIRNICGLFKVDTKISLEKLIEE